jgi:UrcA family protein
VPFLENGERAHAIGSIHGSSIEGENHVDTSNASPNRPLRISGFLTAGLAVIVGLWLMGIAAGTAVAQTPPDDNASEAVSYADLDLSKAEGARTLLYRIDRAARRACGPEPTYSPLLPRAASFYRGCVIDAAGAAVARIDAPLLTAMHDERKPAGATLASR